MKRSHRWASCCSLLLFGQLVACTNITGLSDFDYTLATTSGAGGGGAGGGGPDVPTFWEYRSTNLSDVEIMAFNSAAATAGINEHVQFDAGNDDYWFNIDQGEVPIITPDGLLSSVRPPGASSPSSALSPWANGAGATTHPYSRSFSVERRYRFGFEVFLPAAAETWTTQIDWAAVMQSNQLGDGSSDDGRGVPFMVGIEPVDGVAQWYVAVRGDAAPSLDGNPPSYEESSHPSAKAWLPIVDFDRWYQFELEVVWSYSGSAETRVSVDGAILYDNSADAEPAFKNCFNDTVDDVSIGPFLPSVGIHSYADLSSTMELRYDNIWFADLGAP